MIVRLPMRTLEVTGAKATLMVQFAPTPRAEPQLFVSLKSSVVAVLRTAKGVEPGLLNSTDWVGLLKPTISFAKKSLRGNEAATGEFSRTESEFPAPRPKFPMATSRAPLPLKSAAVKPNDEPPGEYW